MTAKRTINAPNEEPENAKFEKPSEKEHLFQIVDIVEFGSEIGMKLRLDEDGVSVKCEVVGGEEEGRTLLQRLTLSDHNKGFFATRIFLKAIGEEYKGQILIDTDRWIGRQFYATVVHNEKYANIDTFNFDKKVEQQYRPPVGETKKVSDPKEIQWDN